MIVCSNNKEVADFSTFVDGDLGAITDISVPYKSERGSCRAYGLLEASLGYCLTTTVREYARAHNIALDEIKVSVNLDLSDRRSPFIEKKIEFSGNLSDLDRRKLMKASETCSIYKMLLKGVDFN